MRQIDKSERISIKYKVWEEQLEKSSEAHPKYTSSKFEFYYDIVMDLFRCQQGLCAYTEQQLCPTDFYNNNHWENGSYIGDKIGFNGQLDHFDATLKSKKEDKKGKKDWLWDNFFMVDSDTNRRKGNQQVDLILKPDTAEYNPFELFDYSCRTHRYIAKSDLPDEKKSRINNMIEVLGINFPNLISKRKTKVSKAIDFGFETSEKEFPTAFEFCKQQK